MAPTGPVASTTAANTLYWISRMIGTHWQQSTPMPIRAVTTVDRHGLAVALRGEGIAIFAGDDDATKSLKATMLELGVIDIGFRMLSNAELAAAQGFHPDYVFAGGLAEVTRQIGNSVSPSVAEAITKAILSA